MNQELTAEQARRVFDPAALEMETTENLSPLQGIIGQKRAVSALQFGLGIQGSGYNIYIAGPPGIGKMTAVEAFLDEFAQRKPVPPDWCYVTNFDDPYQPQVLTLPPGRGKKLQQDMKELIERVRREIPKAFESDDYSTRRDAIGKQLDRARETVIGALSERAQNVGLKLEAGSFGIAFAPVVEGRELKQEEYEALPEMMRQEIELHHQELEGDLREALKTIRGIERDAQQALAQMDEQIVEFIVGGLMQDLTDDYADQPEVITYLQDVQGDLCENIDMFKPQPQPDGAPPEATPSPLARSLQQDFPLRKYQVNVLIDNGKQTGAPVIVELTPTYTNLIGRIERETHLGALYTDLTMLKGGALHRANGGYLVLPAEELLRNSYSWEGVKGALRTGEIQIEEIGERMAQVTTKSLRPQPIPLDVKVILIGSPSTYYFLYDDDEDFPQFFKVKADFDTTMPRTDENIRDLVHFIATLCQKEELKHLDRGGIAHILDHASRLAEDQAKLSTHFGALADVIREAHFWAVQAESPLITVEHVHKALDEKVYRSNLAQERIRELISRRRLLINTSGATVGQVNGLSIISRGDYEFGRPSRITASVGPGREGIIDIEREVQMSGPIHSKGILILSGYLRYKYAPDRPLTLGARVVFEQSYQGVEGDSASSAELYALLSALSGLPLKQGIAVTGSVNQHGEVQAIGGVNEKIEGFFEVCKTRELTGEQGVLIPESNVQDLMLREDVVAAIRASQFHVWSVKTIDEGIEILTGAPAGESGADGRYPAGTVNDRVSRRLGEFNRSWKEVVRNDEPAEN
ncbi:MAG: ATP-binding protein [Anaerolineae bacterium]